MSHKNKKYSHANVEREQKQKMQSTGSDSSTTSSITKGIAGSGMLIAGIGIASGAAALYLLRTERGRELSSQIRTTVNDSVCQLQEKFNERFSSLKDSITELAGRWNINMGSNSESSDSQFSSTSDSRQRVSNDTESTTRLRRVV